MNSSNSISLHTRLIETREHATSYSKSEFLDVLSKSLKQQHDGKLKTLLDHAQQDHNLWMIGRVGEFMVHAKPDQESIIVNWNKSLSHEQQAVFEAGLQCGRLHLDLFEDRFLSGKEASQKARPNPGTDNALSGSLLAEALARGPIGSAMLSHLDARSVASLSLVSKDIRTLVIKQPRFEAANLFKDFPDSRGLRARFNEFLGRIEQSKCVETKSEGLTHMAGLRSFGHEKWESRQLLLLDAIKTLPSNHLRAKPLAALMSWVQDCPVFTSPPAHLRDDDCEDLTDPDNPSYDELPVGPMREPLRGWKNIADQLRPLWQSAMDLDLEWQRPTMTALLNRSCGRHELVPTILKEVYASDKESWKSTLLIALGDCYRSIKLKDKAQALVVLALMKQTKGGPEFLALKLLPDFIAQKATLKFEEFSTLLDFISTLTPSLQKPALLALAETLVHRNAYIGDLERSIPLMLKVCEATEDRDFEYALRLEVNKGIHNFALLRRNSAEFQQAARQAAERFEGAQRTALLVTLGLASISDILTTNLSKRIDTRTLIALAATGQRDEADALKSHLLQFPESNPPELLVALINRELIDIGYFVDAIGQLPVEQQIRPLRALMYQCRKASAEEMRPHWLALGELCRQSPCRAELLPILSIHFTGKMDEYTREAVPMPLELFDSIHNDMARMSDIDRCAAYFALSRVVELYAKWIAAPRRAKLENVFKSLERLTPPKGWH